MEQTKYDVFISCSRRDYVDEYKNAVPGNEMSKIKNALTKAGINFRIDEKNIIPCEDFAVNAGCRLAIRRIIFTFAVMIMNTFMTPVAAQSLGRGSVVTTKGWPVADVAITLKDRPTYISDGNGYFRFAFDDGQYVVERIEKPGYRLVSPQLPFVQKDGYDTLKVVMESVESPEQRAVREKGSSLYGRVIECERQRLYGDGADLMIERANLDTMNVRWQYETGKYMYKYGDYATAQKYYNRAIQKAKELYGDKNQYLAICYQLYGDNYYEWKAWGENSALNYADAKTYYQQAGHFWYSLYGENNNYTARIYNKMGLCWYRLENEKNAMECFQKALKVLKAIPDAIPAVMANTYANLVLIASKKDDKTEALGYLNEELKYQRMATGEMSQDVAQVYLNLVAYYYGAADYDKTMELLLKVLAIEKHLYGESSELYQKVLHQIDLLKKEMESAESE